MRNLWVVFLFASFLSYGVWYGHISKHIDIYGSYAIRYQKANKKQKKQISSEFLNVVGPQTVMAVFILTVISIPAMIVSMPFVVLQKMLNKSK